MHRMPKLIALTAALLVAPAADAGAQQPIVPQAIDSSSAPAKRARAVAELVLAGDRRKLEAYLKANAAPAYAGAPSFNSALTELLDATAKGARTIVRLDGLGAMGVGVALAQGRADQPERAIVVGLEPAAPHRVTALRIVPIGGPGE